MYEPLHASSPHAGGMREHVGRYVQLMVYVSMPVVGDYPHEQHGRYEYGSQRRDWGSRVAGG